MTGPKPPDSPARRLESWKEISAYLGRTTRTVQRWERTEGLPVHRHVHQDQSSVYAYTDELDEWLAARTTTGSPRATETTESHTVHDLRIKARYLLGTRTAAGLLAAVREYQAAVAHDPTDAMSYAGLAEAYCALGGNEVWSPEDAYTKARAAALQALSLDNQVAEAAHVLAMVHNLYDWQWTQSEERFLEAIRLAPSCATAYHWLGLMYVNSGRPQRALSPLQRASELDPLSPAIAANRGRPLLFLGDLDGAVAHFQRAFDLDPAFWMAHLFIGWAHAAAGRREAAVEAVERAANESGGIRVTYIALAEMHAVAGHVEKASELLDAALHESTIRYLSPYRVARVHNALGHVDAAFHWLDRALLDRSLGSTTCLNRDPALRALRRDARFARYVRAMNLPA